MIFVEERLFFNSHDGTRTMFADRNFFTQRFTGFFVPPVSSLYTFNVRSDDESRLFLSSNASSNHLQRIINIPRWTSNR